MILGIGTDILKIQRIRDSYENELYYFFEKVYTVKEREQAACRSDPVLYFATRFAGKEAVFKCFGTDYSAPGSVTRNFKADSNEIRLNEIEILGEDMTQPVVKLSGTCSEIASNKGIKNIQVSLSFDNDYAIAFAIAQD